MKIAFDAKRLFNNFTGLGNYSRTVVTGLLKSFPHSEYRLYTPKIVDCAVTRPILKSSCCHPVLPDGPIGGSFWRTFGQSKQMKREGIDLFHGLSHEIPVGLSKVNIPSVVTMHDVAYRTFPPMYSVADRILYDAKYGYACRHASHIIAISQSTKTDVIQFYGINPEKISVIHQPVNDLFYVPLSDSEATRLVEEALPLLPKEFCLCVGSINERKNLLTVLQALEIFPQEARPFLLAVGEGGAYREKVEAYAKSHGLTSSFAIASKIRDSKVLQALYAKASLLVYPSFYEGFGLPVVEAALQSCPVITSNVSSLPEAGGDGAILVDPNSPRELFEAMDLLLSNNAKRCALGKIAATYAREHFDPIGQAQKLMSLYETVLKNRGK